MHPSSSPILSPYTPYGARRAFRTLYGPTRIHLACYSLRRRRDGNADTTILYHLHIDRRTHSLSVMTTDRRELLEDGQRRRIRRGSRTFLGLRAGRSSRQTKPEYTAAGRRHDHATFGSGPTRQSDDLDSEPDYLLRPTRHGQGMILKFWQRSFISDNQRIDVSGWMYSNRPALLS